MKTIRLPLITAVLLISTLAGKGQHISNVTALDTLVFETSGLIFLNQRLITHNDSGGEPALYEIDTSSGGIKRKVIVRNAINRDWEDICCDENYIYIGNFGNNYGNRKDLGIYRVSISDYLATESDSVDAEVINFSYAEQKNFNPDPFYTNFDTEAVISYRDSLFIFTKNWGDNMTYIYGCPKMPGTYQLSKPDILNSKGLVTGATYNQSTKTILLSGYSFSFPFLVKIENITSPKFSDGDVKRYLLPLKGSTQIEGITTNKVNTYYFSSEANKKGPSTLYSLNTNDLSEMKLREVQAGKTIVIRLISLVKNSSLFNLFWKLAMLYYL